MILWSVSNKDKEMKNSPSAIPTNVNLESLDEGKREQKDRRDHKVAENRMKMRTRVYWNGMREYYQGTITEIKFDKQWMAKVCYDDGEVFWECLDVLQDITGSSKPFIQKINDK